MTNREQKVLLRGVGGGMIIGLALGLMIALFLAINPKPGAGTITTLVIGLVVALVLMFVAIKPGLFAARTH